MTTPFVPREEFDRVVAELEQLKGLRRELYERRGITRDALEEFSEALDDIQRAARRAGTAVRSLVALYPPDDTERDALEEVRSSSGSPGDSDRSDRASQDPPPPLRPVQ